MNDLSAIELPTLSDGGFVVRPYRPYDAAAVATLCADPETQRWWPLPAPYKLAHAERWVSDAGRRWRDDAWATFAIDDAAGAFVGSCDVRVDRERESGDIGYMVAPAARRRGVATASVRLLARWGFETLGLGRLQIHADARNTASHGVIERAGFTREGVLRSYDLIHGERVDCVFFSLLPDDPM